MRTADPSLLQSPWHAGWFSPLNLAAYVTWLAIALQAPEWPRVLAGDPRQLLGVAALLAMLAAYLGAGAPRRTPRPQLERVLVIAQALAVLLASECLRDGGPAVLMIIVAGQAIAMWPVRQAIAGLAAANLVLLALWLQGIDATSALLSLVSLAAFQSFAALTVHYATSAETARQQLAHTHAELLATQRLLEDSARSGERLRLSRELHDVAGHKLTALKLNLRLLERDPVLAARDEVRVAANLADELLQDIRAVVSELRKHDGIDLPAAIATLAQQIPGTRFRLDLDPGLRVEDVDRAEILLRCAQEGITNALRHGRPSTIEVGLHQHADRLELRIGNDGAPLRAPHFGNGLTGMRERLAAAGGLLDLTPRASGGADLTAVLPAHG
ncbi:MAG: sensor histidine kinase [Rhodanobacteraceae bacterium]|nr:sensor histidine kinase [Rhodanobacteraceae bacterium]